MAPPPLRRISFLSFSSFLCPLDILSHFFFSLAVSRNYIPQFFSHINIYLFYTQLFTTHNDTHSLHTYITSIYSTLLSECLKLPCCDPVSLHFLPFFLLPSRLAAQQRPPGEAGARRSYSFGASCEDLVLKSPFSFDRVLTRYPPYNCVILS